MVKNDEHYLNRFTKNEDKDIKKTDKEQFILMFKMTIKWYN